jgi:TM2 domain-containing membrane protein YozV
MIETPPAAIATTDPTVTVYDGRPVRRIVLFAIIAWAICFGLFTFRGDYHFLLGLTCAAAATIIHFLWLGEVLTRLLQPVPQVSAWKHALRALTRFVFLAVALSIAILVIRFNVLSVLLGVSVLVAGVIGEALYELLIPEHPIGE